MVGCILLPLDRTRLVVSLRFQSLVQLNSYWMQLLPDIEWTDIESSVVFLSLSKKASKSISQNGETLSLKEQSARVK